jgi:hypothetical protein
MSAPELCARPMRGGTCNLEAGHRGRHTTVAWSCDGCGKLRRGSPTVRDPEGGWFCFLCAPAQDTRRHHELLDEEAELRYQALADDAELEAIAREQRDALDGMLERP